MRNLEEYTGNKKESTYTDDTVSTAENKENLQQ